MLYLIPHRMLHGVPLHALPLAAGPLAQSHPVAYVPMAGLLPLVQNAAGRTQRLHTCASFGVVFDAEAHAVAEIFGASAVTRVDLTPDEVLTHCTDKDVCHFSCHGHFDAVTPLSSGLILRTGDAITRDPAGVLTARAVMESRLNTELVCLSACQTAMSEIGEGDELIDLVRAFLQLVAKATREGAYERDGVHYLRRLYGYGVDFSEVGWRLQTTPEHELAGDVRGCRAGSISLQRSRSMRSGIGG